MMLEKVNAKNKGTKKAKPPFKKGFMRDRSGAWSHIEETIFLMLYAEGYYHLFDGTYEAWWCDIDKEGLITVESVSQDGLKADRIDRLEFREIGKMLNKIEFDKEIHDFYQKKIKETGLT